MNTFRNVCSAAFISGVLFGGSATVAMDQFKPAAVTFVAGGLGAGVTYVYMGPEATKTVAGTVLYATYQLRSEACIKQQDLIKPVAFLLANTAVRYAGNEYGVNKWIEETVSENMSEGYLADSVKAVAKEIIPVVASCVVAYAAGQVMGSPVKGNKSK